MKYIIAVLLVVAASHVHAACSEPVALDRAQVNDLTSILESDETSENEKYGAFLELSCATDDFAKQSAIDLALKNGGDSLRVVVTKDVTFGRETLILEPFDNGALTDEQRDWAAQKPALLFNFVHKDFEANCIGLSSSTCQPGHVLDICGPRVSIVYRKHVAELSMTDEGILEGFFVPSETSLRIPVQARLR